MKTSTISIVDDDPSAREGMTDLVRSMGYEAQAYECAEDFLKSGHLDRTDCLITDMRMPGMSGLALYERLAASESFDTDDHDYRLSRRSRSSPRRAIRRLLLFSEALRRKTPSCMHPRCSHRRSKEIMTLVCNMHQRSVASVRRIANGRSHGSTQNVYVGALAMPSDTDHRHVKRPNTSNDEENTMTNTIALDPPSGLISICQCKGPQDE